MDTEYVERADPALRAGNRWRARLSAANCRGDGGRLRPRLRGQVAPAGRKTRS